MSEVIVFPEMVEAGIEALDEGRENKLPDIDVAIAVYLAMQAVYEMRVLKEANETRH